MNLSLLIKTDNSVFYGPDAYSRNQLEDIQQATSRHFGRLNIVHLTVPANTDEVDIREKYQFDVCSV